MNTRYEAAQALKALIDDRRQATRLLRLSFPKDGGASTIPKGKSAPGSPAITGTVN